MTVGEMIQKIEDDLGIGTPEYHEAMWMLFSVLARRHACIADDLRRNARRRARADETRETNKRRKQALADFKKSELMGGDAG